MVNKKFKIPFAGIGARYTEEDKKVVFDAMDATTTFTQGEYQLEFEKNFSSFVGTKHAFATSSALGALDISAMLCQFQEGDEVICPAHTYAASAYPFAKYGAKIVWADINADTFVIDLNQIEKVFTPKTKAIIVVHLYGLPANMHEIMQFAKDKNILVIEDCAQAIGATINQSQVGSFGDIGVFSFQSHKNISTLGEGGMITTNNDAFATLIPGLRHNGHKPYNRPDPNYYWLPAMVNLDFDISNIWPDNYCLGEVQCALGNQMIKRVDQIIKVRKERFHKFKEAFANMPIKIQEIPEGYLSAHHLLPFQNLHPRLSRDEIIHKLAYEYGIQCVVQYYPLYRYPLFHKAGFGSLGLKNTDNFFDNMVSIPFHYWLEDEEFNLIIESIKDLLTTH